MAQDNSTADPTLDGIINSYLQQNTAWVNAAKDDDDRAERERKLQERVSAIANAYGRYGQAAFTPKAKPSELNVPWAQNSYSGQQPFSPLDIGKVESQYATEHPPAADDIPSLPNSDPQVAAYERAAYRQPEPEATPTGLLAFADRNAKSAADAMYRGELGALQLGYNLDPGARALLLGRDEKADAADFAKAAQLEREKEDYSPSAAEGTTGNIAGSFGSGLLTLGADMFNRPFDVTRDTGSLAKGYEDLAVTAPEYMATMALGKIPGALPARIVGGAAGGASIDAAATATRNAIGEKHEDVFDPERLAYAAGGGAAMGALGEGKPSVRKPLPTRDPDIKAGAEAGTKANEKRAAETEPKQSDLFNNEEAYGVDMFDSKTVPADVIESRRKQAELANENKELPQRSKDEDLDLEKNYLFSQNERLRNLAAEEPKVSTDDMWDVGAKGVVEQKLADPNANAAMAGAFEQAGLRRGLGLGDTNLYPDIRSKAGSAPARAGEPFAPSRNTTVEQTAEQGNLELPLQQDLFNGTRANEAPRTAAPVTPAVTAATRSPVEKLTPKQRAQKLLDDINEDEGAAHPAPATNSSGRRLPYSVLDAADGGELTSQHVIDSVADNHESIYNEAPHAQAYAKVLRDAGNKLGGLDTKIEVIDPNNITPEHQAVIDRLNNGDSAIPFDKSAGVYDPKTNKIYINGKGNLSMDTLMHESTHGITHRAISLGENGKLEGPAKHAFDRLNVLFDTLKPHLEARGPEVHSDFVKAGVRPDLAANRVENAKYGLTNLHEMMSEMFSNGKFRAYLKGLKLDAIDQGKLGMGRLALGKVRNMYEAVVKNVRDMLGLSPKADNALDALFSSSHDFLHSFSDKEASAIATHNNREGAPAFKPSEQFKPTVTDPLSRTQKLKELAKVPFKRFDSTFQTVRKYREEANSKSTAAAHEATELGKSLHNVMQKEGAPNDKVLDYLGKKDMSVLDAYPKTKAVADKFDVTRQENRKELARQIVSNPNATAKDVEFAEHIYHNPGYLMRKYQGEKYTADVMRTAQKAEALEAKGKELTPAQQKAKEIVDGARQVIKQNMLPAADFETKQLSSLKKMAKDLGLNANKALQKAGDKLSTDEKREVVKQLIKDFLPDDAAVKRAEDGLLLQVAGVVENKGLSVARYFRNARLGNILTEREAVPPQIRALWGEVSDAASQVAHTYLKQETGIIQLKQQAKLHDLGLEKGWLREGKFSEDGFTAKLNGRKMGSLQNLYTTPMVKRMLDSTVQISKASDSWLTATFSGNEAGDKAMFLAKKAGAVIPRAVTGFKIFTMALDPLYWQMCAYGGPSIMLTHGTLNPRLAIRGLAAHIAELNPDSIKLMPEAAAKQVKSDLDLIRRYGLSEPNASGEYYKFLEGRYLKEALESGGEEGFAKMFQRTMGAAVSAPTRIGMHLMSLGDGWAKRAAFLHRIEVMDAFNERQGTKPTNPKELKEYYDNLHSDVADWVKDTTITYGRAPVLARISESYAGTSKGLVYVTETTRNLYNGIAHGLADFRMGMEAKDATMILHGTKQLMGSVTAGTMVAGVIGKTVGVGLAALGLASSPIASDDEKQKLLQQKGSRFEGQKVEEITGTGDDKHNYLHSSGDMFDYYYQFSEATHVITDAIAKHERGEKVDLDDVTHKALGAYIGTLWRGSLMNTLIKEYNAILPGWQNDVPKFTEAERTTIKNGLNLSEANVNRAIVAVDAVMPGMIKRWLQASESKGNDTIKNLMRSGFSITAVPKDAGLSDKTADKVKNRLIDAGIDFAKTVSNPADYSKEAISESYKKAFKQNYDVLKDLQGAISYAKSNHLTNGDIMKSMMIGKIPEDAIVQAYTGKLNPAEMMYKDLTSKLKDQLQSTDDPERKQQLISRYSARMRQLGGLTQEYMKLTPQQIEEMR
jgi:hypothetical protein